MAKVVGLGGVFFKSEDPQKLADWYQQWLQMDLTFPNGATFTPEAVPRNGYQVWGPFAKDTEYFNPSKQDFMINLMVDDLDAMLEQLKPSGCQIMDDTEKSEFGYFGWFIDPDGNKVELWQPPTTPPEV
ncbi:MAG: VOC family protein [Kangiellaceae bacterium]|nr:VOC family protein [Kangiellaceae bacterium]MCW9000258.1 VOC family protein [Kangiellaceae bacterium]MCW9015569.1 VOC family protein [Kangiellaceae bacterium]